MSDMSSYAAPLQIISFQIMLFMLCGHSATHLRHHHRSRRSSQKVESWPFRRIAEIPGEITIGGLHMVHERQDQLICGPVMPQGGLQATEVMLYTIDKVNQLGIMPQNVTLGAHILDDCDKDTYGLQQAVDFIKGTFRILRFRHIVA